MLATEQRKRYASQRLSHPDSVRFLGNAKSLLTETSYGRTKQFANMLGCGKRTAQRLLNISDEKVPKLRKSYLRSAVAYTGVSAISLVGRVSSQSDIQRHANKLMSGLPALDQFNEVSSLASSMARHCMFGYGMPASFAVDCNAGLESFSARVMFRNPDYPGVLHEVAVVKDDHFKWRLKYDHPKDGCDWFKGVLSDDNFDKILKFVKNLTYVT